MSESEKRRRRIAADRERDARKKAESDHAAWTARANQIAAADPLNSVREAAGELVRSGTWADEAATALQGSFPSLPTGVLAAVSREAYGLLELAGEVANQFREHRISKNEALEQLLAACPGFSAASYERYFGAGMFGTR